MLTNPLSRGDSHGGISTPYLASIVQDGDNASRIRWIIIGTSFPHVNASGERMIQQFENLDRDLPKRFVFGTTGDWDTGNVEEVRSIRVADYLRQFVDRCQRSSPLRNAAHWS